MVSTGNTMVFPVAMYGCESLSIKKAECWRCLLTVVLKMLQSPLDCKEIKSANPKGNQPWIFTGNTDAEAEAPILWPPDEKSWLTEKTMMLRKIEGRRRRGWQRRRWLDGIIYSMGMSLSKFQEIVKNREALHAAVHGVAKSQTWVSDWTTTYIEGLALSCPSLLWRGSLAGLSSCTSPQILFQFYLSSEAIRVKVQGHGWVTLSL